MPTSALLIVDVQKDFCSGGALAVPQGDRVVPVLNRYIAEAVARNMPIYASRDWHPSVSQHFKPYGGEWPPHCVQNTDGARFHPALQLPTSTVVITKGDGPAGQGYSAFEGHTVEGKTFLTELNERNVDHLLVGGLATNFCVKHSVLGALRAGLAVTVLQDAIAGIDLEPGDSERALVEMRQAGAQVVESWPR